MPQKKTGFIGLASLAIILAVGFFIISDNGNTKDAEAECENGEVAGACEVNTEGLGATEESNRGVLKTISPGEFKRVLGDDREEVILIDLRTQMEYESGKIGEAMMLDFYADDFTVQLQKMNPEETYLIYCNSGNRSGETLEYMKSFGFKEVYDLDGGIQAWARAGYPIN